MQNGKYLLVLLGLVVVLTRTASACGGGSGKDSGGGKDAGKDGGDNGGKDAGKGEPESDGK